MEADIPGDKATQGALRKLHQKIDEHHFAEKVIGLDIKNEGMPIGIDPQQCGKVQITFRIVAATKRMARRIFKEFLAFLRKSKLIARPLVYPMPMTNRQLATLT